MPPLEEVATTAVIRIPRYLRDEILRQARTGGGYSGQFSRAPARVLLERLDPEVAEKYPNVPRNRR